ncbi:hypothetical protein Pelo_1808 [Pelomyxa schiedti]|nr:hypothetical protein Pelo_1808 [Pelomyxa schiedti]
MSLVKIPLRITNVSQRTHGQLLALVMASHTRCGAGSPARHFVSLPPLVTAPLWDWCLHDTEVVLCVVASLSHPKALCYYTFGVSCSLLSVTREINVHNCCWAWKGTIPWLHPMTPSLAIASDATLWSREYSLFNVVTQQKRDLLKSTSRSMANMSTQSGNEKWWIHCDSMKTLEIADMTAEGDSSGRLISCSVVTGLEANYGSEHFTEVVCNRISLSRNIPDEAMLAMSEVSQRFDFLVVIDVQQSYITKKLAVLSFTKLPPSQGPIIGSCVFMKKSTGHRALFVTDKTRLPQGGVILYEVAEGVGTMKSISSGVVRMSQLSSFLLGILKSEGHLEVWDCNSTSAPLRVINTEERLGVLPEATSALPFLVGPNFIIRKLPTSRKDCLEVMAAASTDSTIVTVATISLTSEFTTFTATSLLQHGIIVDVDIDIGTRGGGVAHVREEADRHAAVLRRVDPPPHGRRPRGALAAAPPAPLAVGTAAPGPVVGQREQPRLLVAPRGGARAGGAGAGARGGEGGAADWGCAWGAGMGLPRGSAPVGSVTTPSKWSEVLSRALGDASSKPTFEEAVMATGMKNPMKVIEMCRNIVDGIPESDRHDREAYCAVALYTLDLGRGESNPNALLNRAISEDNADLLAKWRGVISLLVTALTEMQPCLVLTMYIVARINVTEEDKALFWTTFSSATTANDETDVTFLKSNSFENDPRESILSLSGVAFDLTEFSSSGKKEFLIVPGRKYSIISRSTSCNALTPILNLFDTHSNSPLTKILNSSGTFKRTRKEVISINTTETGWLVCEPATPKWDPSAPNEVNVEFRPPIHPYSLGFYVVTFKLPCDYPFKAPIVKFKTPILHPNLNNQFGLCCCDCMLPVLGNQWMPNITIQSVMNSICSWMQTESSWTENACGGRPDIRQLYLNNKAEFMRQAENHVRLHAIHPQLETSALYFNT